MTGFFLARTESLTWGISKTKLWRAKCVLNVSAFKYRNRNMFSISISYFLSNYVFTLIVYKYYELIFLFFHISFSPLTFFFILSLSHYISLFSLMLSTFSILFCFQLCFFLLPCFALTCPIFQWKKGEKEKEKRQRKEGRNVEKKWYTKFLSEVNKE